MGSNPILNCRVNMQPQIPELAYECFRTVMSATSNQMYNTRRQRLRLHNNTHRLYSLIEH